MLEVLVALSDTDFDVLKQYGKVTFSSDMLGVAVVRLDCAQVEKVFSLENVLAAETIREID